MEPIMRMAGFDAGFLYMETPSVHMHTLKIAVLEPSEDNTFDNLIEKLTELMIDKSPIHLPRGCGCCLRCGVGS